jgi:filamentous hemagglutinin
MHDCWKQGAIGAAKVVAGTLSVSTGATLCGASGAGCLAGVPIMAFGASDATQGATMMMDAYQGITSQGVNPLKTLLTEISPDYGGVAYDTLSLIANVGSLGARIPIYVGATDGIAQTGSIFGVTTTRWNNASALANSVTGQVGQTLNRFILGGSVAWKAIGLGNSGN